jgi:hypothetical protein
MSIGRKRRSSSGRLRANPSISSPSLAVIGRSVSDRPPAPTVLGYDR